VSRNDEAAFEEEEELDLRELGKRLWAGRAWVVATTILSTIVFVIVAFMMTPFYKAQTVLVPAQHEGGMTGSLGSALGQLGGLASLAGVNLGGSGPQVEEALAVLRSREFTERFILDHDMMPILFAERWDAQSKQWRTDKKVPMLVDASRYFQKKVRSISQDKKTGLVTVAIEWSDPALAASWANALVLRLNSEMRQRAIVSSDASLQYLQKELQGTTAIDTRVAINRLIENQINQRMFANVTEEYSFRVVDRALPPALDDKVRPNKAILAGSGLVLGLIIGAAIALIRAALAERRQARQPG
jgi:uncharacterized protein involved in exopolysaccharide biosynthesis